MADSTPDNTATVLVFSQSGLQGGLKKIREKATVRQAYYNKPGECAALLHSFPSARAIWIVDPDIALPLYDALSRQVVAYVRSGGTAVLGGFFSSLIQPTVFDEWMQGAWGLPWCSGQYERTTVVLQSAAAGRGTGPGWRKGLMESYSCKAVFLQDVAPEDSWYASPPGATSESLVFGPVPVLSETAVAFAKVGEGWLGYTGDVNSEDGTTMAILAMMGLNVDA